jgi:hypothetical protein
MVYTCARLSWSTSVQLTPQGFQCLLRFLSYWCVTLCVAECGFSCCSDKAWCLVPHRPQAELLVRDRCAHQLPMWSPLLLPSPAVR